MTLNEAQFYCPVPKDQQPTEEFTSLCESWFFSLAITNNIVEFRKKLLYIWLSILPFGLIVAQGSRILRGDITHLLIVGNLLALSLPIFVLIRLYLGWNFILGRLKSEIIEYEESGWYDGQIWEKPISWRQKDLLIAQHQVNPIIKNIENGIFNCFMIFLTCAIIYLVT